MTEAKREAETVSGQAEARNARPRRSKAGRANGPGEAMAAAAATPSPRPKHPDAALVKLLRHLVKGPCRLAQADAGRVRLGGAASDRLFEMQTVRRAVSLGLAQQAGDELVATKAASNFLRRALLAAEDAFSAQHRETVEQIVEIDGRRSPVQRNLQESPLAAMARLKDRSGAPFLPPEAVEAGERLHADFTRGQLQPRITASWEPRLSTRGKGQAGGRDNIADSAIAARLRVSSAMDAMGPELAGVAVDVCCFEKGLEAVERDRQWPARSAKLMLRTALLALSRHYHPPRPQQKGRRHHWGAEDFRPVLS